jgi:hypothetical protein
MKLALIISLVVLTVPILGHAEISEYIFTDTHNAEKHVTPDKIFINPATYFNTLNISGLDRYITLNVTDASGAAMFTTTTDKVTVNDRLQTENGTEFYGKKISIPAMGEGTYTISEVIKDLQQKVISQNNYTATIDRTGPTIAKPIGYTRNGWSFGSEANFTPRPEGGQYMGVAAITLSGLEDSSSGLNRAEYFVIDSKGNRRVAPQVINKVEKSITVQVDQAGGPTLAPESKAEYQIGFDIYDNAGNKTTVSRLSNIDRTIPAWSIEIQNANSGVWEPYVAKMKIFKNPVQYRIKRNKSDSIKFNGSVYGWADNQYQSTDSQYFYSQYSVVYPDVWGIYKEFETNAGGVMRFFSSTFSFTYAPGVEAGPIMTDRDMKIAERGNVWQGSTVRNNTISMTDVKFSMEKRNYSQKIWMVDNENYFCVIPAGETTCTTAVDFKHAGRGWRNVIISAGKSTDNTLNTEVGTFSVLWDSNPPTIINTSTDKIRKKMSLIVVDNDRINTWQLPQFDTQIFMATLRNAKGEAITLNPVSVSESDYKTKLVDFSYSGLPDGNYTLVSVTATDTMGNTASQALNQQILIDSAPPEISFSYQGKNAEGLLIKGLENLVITLKDSSMDSTIQSMTLTGGPNSDNVKLTTKPTGSNTYVPEYPRLFPSLQSDAGSYTILVTATDGSGNSSSKRVTFNYEPNNLVLLDRLRTFGAAKALSTTDNRPLAYLKTSVLRRQDGSIVTGKLVGTMTVRKDGAFAITIADTTVFPGETKEIVLDMGQGEEKIYPIFPAQYGVTGTSFFIIEFPQV